MDENFDRRDISDLLKALFCVFLVGQVWAVGRLKIEAAIPLMFLMWAVYALVIYCFAPYNTANIYTRLSWLALPLAILASAGMVYWNLLFLQAAVLCAMVVAMFLIWYFRPMDGKKYFVEILSVDPSGDYENWWANAKIIDTGQIITRMLSPQLADSAQVGQKMFVRVGPQHELYQAE